MGMIQMKILTLLFTLQMASASSKQKRSDWEKCGETVNKELLRILPDLCAGIQYTAARGGIQGKISDVTFRDLQPFKCLNGYSLERLGWKGDVEKKLSMLEHDTDKEPLHIVFHMSNILGYGDRVHVFLLEKIGVKWSLYQSSIPIVAEPVTLPGFTRQKWENYGNPTTFKMAKGFTINFKRFLHLLKNGERVFLQELYMTDNRVFLPDGDGEKTGFKCAGAVIKKM